MALRAAEEQAGEEEGGLRTSEGPRPPSVRAARRPRRSRLEISARSPSEVQSQQIEEQRPLVREEDGFRALPDSAELSPDREASGRSKGMEDLCRAIANGEMSVQPAPSTASVEVGRYVLEGAEVSVRLALRNGESYTLLICGTGHWGDRKVEEALSGLATGMGYVHTDKGVYLRQDGGVIATVKFGPVRIGMARGSTEAFSGEAVAEHVRRMHGELDRFVSAQSSARSSSRAVRRSSRGVSEPARRAQLACPECGVTVGVYEDEVGEWGTCPSCTTRIHIPPDAFEGGNPALEEVRTEVRRSGG